MLRRLRNIFSHQSTRPTVSPTLYRNETPFQYWKLVKELGDGSFGKVHQAISIENEQIAAAVKVIEYSQDDELPEHLVEIQILKDCRQKNIIELIDAFLFEKKLFIFLEFCQYGAVDQIMNTLEHSLDEKQIRFIALEVLHALNYLHEEKFVIHRDLKASNILLGDNGQVKLADFGVSIRNSFRDEKRNEYIGTVYWMAPEVFFCEADQNATYDFRVDLWSFGITCIEMAEMDPPHHEIRPERVGTKIRQALPPTLKQPTKWSEEFSSFISSCLKREPNERLTAEQLQKHSFMIDAQSCQSAILYLLEEFRTPPVVELVDEEPTTKIEENNQNNDEDSLFSDEEEEEEEELESGKVLNQIVESPPIVQVEEKKADLPDEFFEMIFDDLLEEVLQSDCEEPSIPEVILAVITELTNDPNIYYSYVRQSVENNELNEYFLSVPRRRRRQTIKKTRRFVGPDGKQEEIITTKVFQPFNDEQLKSMEGFFVDENSMFRFRKVTEREFRRLNHLEERHRHQILSVQEYELNEQQLEFNAKRRSAQDDFDKQLKHLDDRYSHSVIDRSRYQNEKSHLNEQRSFYLDQLEHEELRQRYDLLRKQTKNFYSSFRQMLRDKLFEQLKQYDEQARIERKNLYESLTNEEQLWTQQWKENERQRYDKFVQQQRNDYEPDYLIRKFQHEENDEFQREKSRLNSEHKRWKDSLYERQIRRRDEIILIQKEKVEQSIDLEREKLEELQRTFEEDLMLNSSHLNVDQRY